ncbi:MAG: septum formation initiator family protein [Angelakisella sp.]
MIRIVMVLLLGVLVAFFIKTQADVENMEQQLQSINQQVEHQRLVNKDLELSLRSSDEYLKRTAREKLDYAHPEERVFIDASGVK